MAFARHRELSSTGFLVANPVAAEHELDRHLHDEALESALMRAQLEGVRGKDVTPALLAEFAHYTAGVSVAGESRPGGRERGASAARIAAALVHLG